MAIFSVCYFLKYTMFCFLPYWLLGANWRPLLLSTLGGVRCMTIQLLWLRNDSAGGGPIDGQSSANDCGCCAGRASDRFGVRGAPNGEGSLVIFFWEFWNCGIWDSRNLGFPVFTIDNVSSSHNARCSTFSQCNMFHLLAIVTVFAGVGSEQFSNPCW